MVSLLQDSKKKKKSHFLQLEKIKGINPPTAKLKPETSTQMFESLITHPVLLSRKVLWPLLFSTSSFKLPGAFFL